MLTKPGVKLLDFGLAKFQDKASVSKDSEQPTQQKPLTDAGAILGTFQYMAPEQLEGKEADARSDIFAFGAVLYEMLTGRKAFEGESQASLITAIMSTDPKPISELHPMSPPALDRLVKKCLAKDPEDRWYSAHDLMGNLEWVAAGDVTVAPAPRPRRAWLPWFLTAVAVLAALFFGWKRYSASPSPEVARFGLELEDYRESCAPLMTLSPDGKYLAYLSTEPGGPGATSCSRLARHSTESRPRAVLR